MTAVLLILGTFAMVGAMVAFALTVTRRTSSEQWFARLATLFFVILECVFRVMGGHMWGHNSAIEDARRSAPTAERK